MLFRSEETFIAFSFGILFSYSYSLLHLQNVDFSPVLTLLSIVLCLLLGLNLLRM